MKTRRALLSLFMTATVAAAGLSAAAPAIAESDESVATDFSLPAQNRAVAPAVAPVGSWNHLSGIRGYRQERSNWCGPASAKTALSNWTDVRVNSSTQAYFAKKMGTNSAGFTTPVAMGREMTNYINASWGTKGTKYAAHRSITNGKLWEGVVSFAQWDRSALIVLVRQRAVHPNAPKAAAHYLTITAWNENLNGKGRAYRAWDSGWGSNGRYITFYAKNWEKMAYAGKLVVAPRF